jgi:hypothetical protein
VKRLKNLTSSVEFMCEKLFVRWRDVSCCFVTVYCCLSTERFEKRERERERRRVEREKDREKRKKENKRWITDINKTNRFVQWIRWTNRGGIHNWANICGCLIRHVRSGSEFRNKFQANSLRFDTLVCIVYNVVVRISWLVDSSSLDADWITMPPCVQISPR